MEVNNHPKERTEYIAIRGTPEEKELLKITAIYGLCRSGVLGLWRRPGASSGRHRRAFGLYG